MPGKTASATTSSNVALFSNDATTPDQSSSRSSLNSRRSKAPKEPVDLQQRPVSSSKPTGPSSGLFHLPGPFGNGGSSKRPQGDRVQLRFAPDVLDDNTSVERATFVRPALLQTHEDSPNLAILAAAARSAQGNGATSPTPKVSRDLDRLLTGNGSPCSKLPTAAPAVAIAGLLTDPMVSAARIQSAWSTFARLSDADRDTFLHGILAQCGSTQVQRICSDLQLRLSTTTIVPLHVHTQDSHNMLVRSSHTRVPLPVSQLSTASQAPLIPHVEPESPMKNSSEPPLAPLIKSPKSNRDFSKGDRGNRHDQKNVQQDTQRNTRITNANMYRKLFPAASFHTPNQAAKNYSQTSGQRPDSAVAEFTAARCSKLEATLTALNQASATPDVHAAALQLMRTIANMLGAQHWAIYNVVESLPEETAKPKPTERRSSRRVSVAGQRRSVSAGGEANDGSNQAARGIAVAASLFANSNDEALQQPQPVTTRRVSATVQCSNWQAVGREISPDSIFGYSYLSSCPIPQPISGAGGVTFMTSPGHVIPNVAVTSPVLNVYQASASEYYNNACHERYPDGVQCVLSAALIGENGLVSAVLELVNKSDPTASPFFDVEDEFILRSTLATWSLVLREAKAERDRDMRDQMLRRILTDLQAMSRVEGLNDLIGMAEKSLANLVSAERATIQLDLSMLDVEEPVRKQLKQGETVVVAHAMSIPRYRQKNIRNLLLVPIMSEQSQITGVIVAMNKLPDETFFVKQDVDNMASFAPLVAVLIYRAKVSRDTSNVMKALENKFALATDTLVSQDSIVLRVNADLWITDCIIGSMCHPCISAQPNSPLVSLVPSLQEVFYDDLKEGIENNVPKFNTDYLVTFAAATPDSQPTSLYIDYSIFPSHLLQTAHGARSAHPSSEILNKSHGRMSRCGSGHLSPTYGSSAHGSAMSSRLGSTEMLSTQANPAITLSSAATEKSASLSSRLSSAPKPGSKPGSPPTNQQEVIIVMHASLDQRRLAKLRSRHFGGPKAPQSNAATLARDPSMLMGAREQATVMLINLHSFSDAALMLSAAEVAGFLSTYYAAVTEVVSAAGGIVLSTSSDRITCVFGLPAANADDAARAIRSSIQLTARLKQEMPTWLARVSDEARISFAIAISSGTVSGGACLFHNVETFAVVGEPVVIVPRLEANARQYGANILLDKTTHDCAKRAYEMREIDIVWMPEYKARGSVFNASSSSRPSSAIANNTAHHRGSPTSPLGSGASLQANGASGRSQQDPPGIMPVYDIIGEVSQIMENDLRTAYICYELGLSEYRQRNFDAAITYFRKCKSLMPDDGPSAVMIERCRMAAEDPDMIPANWDGIWRYDE